MCSVSIEVLCIIMYVSFYVPHDNVAYRSQSENSRFLEITGRLFHINILRPESLFSIFRVIPVLLSQIQTYEVGITSFIYQCKPIWVFRKHLYVGQFSAKNEQHAHIHRASVHSAISVTQTRFREAYMFTKIHYHNYHIFSKIDPKQNNNSILFLGNSYSQIHKCKHNNK